MPPPISHDLTASSPRLLPGFIVALLLNLSAVFLYAGRGYHPAVLWCWLASLGALVIACWTPAPRGLRSPTGLAWLAAVVAAIAPLYLWRLDQVPLQINSDELTVMWYQRYLVTLPSRDLFGLTAYFGFPAMPFLVFGWIGQRLGGITLEHLRLVNGVIGLLIIVAAYAWLRVALPRRLAIAGAALLGGSHALIAISRLALRDNTTVLIELGASALLFRGLLSSNLLATCLGGMVAGLSCYTYYPARVTPILWALWLLALGCRRRPEIPRRSLVTHALVGGLACLAVAGPILVATLKAPGEMLDYPKKQLLILPEGRLEQQRHQQLSSVEEGVRRNLINGLTVFNRPIPDAGRLYINSGDGFVDPLTGVFLWIGLIGIVATRRRPIAWTGRPATVAQRLLDRFVVVGFFTLWFAFTALINKMPNYGRMLVLLPFVSYCALAGIVLTGRGVGEVAGRLRLGGSFGSAVIAVLLAGVISGNVAAYGNYVVAGFREGHDIGSTGRYIAARAGRSGYVWYLASSAEYPYFGWGLPEYWHDWIKFFAGQGQPIRLLAPETMLHVVGPPPFTVFMSDALWRVARVALTRAHPNLVVHELTADGKLLAIEVLP